MTPANFYTGDIMNKTVLITGSNRGIGIGLVEGYLKLNYNVIGTCRTPQRAVELLNLEKLYPTKLTIEQLDVNNPADFRALSAKYASKSIDVLINNAGIFPEDHSRLGLEFADPQKILDAFQTNTVGALMAIQAFQKNLLKAENPKIINMSSQMGSLSAAKGFCYSYRMSKVALNMLTKCFADEYKKIITISLRPGWVKTPMGGPNATLDVKDSVVKVINIIEGLQIPDSGGFFDNEKNICEL